MTTRITPNQIARWFPNASKSIMNCNQASIEPVKAKEAKPAKPEKKAVKNKLQRKFEGLWQVLGGAKLEEEFRFHPVRKWRFDYAIHEIKVAIELEGGVWTNGAHTRGAHFNSDCEKYNQAQLHGWTVFRLTTNMITYEHVQPFINHINMVRARRQLLFQSGEL